MIIFDLDGTLADNEHKQHFVDPKKDPDYELVYMPNKQTESWQGSYRAGFCDYSDMPMGDLLWRHRITKEEWKPDWKSFNQACDKDEPVKPVIETLLGLFSDNKTIQIWSGRSESLRKKTESWIKKHIPIWNDTIVLKMRPIGNTETEELLKDQWLDELYEEIKWERRYSIEFIFDPIIEFVFDSNPHVIQMWRNRGIFVFDCSQKYSDF